MRTTHAIGVATLASLKLRTGSMANVLVTSERVPSPQVLGHTEELGGSRNVTSMGSDKRRHQGGGENI